MYTYIKNNPLNRLKMNINLESKKIPSSEIISILNDCTGYEELVELYKSFSVTLSSELYTKFERNIIKQTYKELKKALP